MLDLTLWVAQGLLALFFLAAGLPKVVGRGLDRWDGFDDIPRGLTVVIGVSEVAGALALVLPSLLGALGWTTPLAAIGIAVVSLMAAGFHVRACEWVCVAETALLAALAGAVTVGRGGVAPAVPPGVLVAAVALLVPAIVVVLVLLARRPVAARGAAGSPQRVVGG
ncbi:DoxX family protein [Pseudonocardia sichuanensis]